MTKEKFELNYHSDNDKVSEYEIFKETLNNYNTEWPETVNEKECSSVRLSCYLTSIPKC